LSDEDAERAAILERQALLADAAADVDLAVDKAEQARGAFEALGDAVGVARIVGVLGSIELKAGRHSQAMALLERAIKSMDPEREPEGYARVASQIARGMMLSGR